MTPLELLEDVKQRFPVLLHDDQEALLSLLRKALMKYQELAGFGDKLRIKQEEIKDNGYSLPPEFFCRLALKDASGRHVSSEVWHGVLEMRITGREQYPLTLHYLKTALGQGWEEFELPDNALSLLSDYLELLISIPNSERHRRIAVAGKLDVSDIPSEADLGMRKAELENSMRLNRAIVPPISIA